MKTSTITHRLSACIAALVQRGIPLPEAVDAVLGKGTYLKIANDIWTELRARKA